MPSPQIVNDVMTLSPRCMDITHSVSEAAQAMRDNAVGAIVLDSRGKVCGIVTDRDIVVRVIAAGGDCEHTRLESICSSEVITLTPRDSVEQAIELMRTHAIRRLPVVDNGRAVGIVSLGDLAQALDGRSALGEISAAAPNG